MSRISLDQSFDTRVNLDTMKLTRLPTLSIYLFIDELTLSWRSHSLVTLSRADDPWITTLSFYSVTARSQCRLVYLVTMYQTRNNVLLIYKKRKKTLKKIKRLRIGIRTLLPYQFFFVMCRVTFFIKHFLISPIPSTLINFGFLIKELFWYVLLILDFADLRQGPALEGRNSPVVATRSWKGNK